jgi:hypothetical protein
MSDILIVILIIIVLIASVSGLIYVGSKLLFNVSNDVSNDPNNQPSTTSQPSPNKPNVSHASTTTSVLGDDTLEAWSENNFQGTKILSLSLSSLKDGFNIRTSSNAKSIRFPSTGYQVYIMTQQQYIAALSGNISNDYSQYSLKIEPNTPLINESVKYIIIIRIPLPTTTGPTKPGPTTTSMGTTYNQFTNSFCAIDGNGTSPYINSSYVPNGVCKTKCDINPMCSGYVEMPYNRDGTVNICWLYGTNKDADTVNKFDFKNDQVPFKAGERVKVKYPSVLFRATCYIRNNA